MRWFIAFHLHLWPKVEAKQKNRGERVSYPNPICTRPPGYLVSRSGHSQVDDEEHDVEDLLDSGSAGSYGSMAGGTMRNSGKMSREVLRRRLMKRIKAWRRFLAVMQVHTYMVIPIIQPLARPVSIESV